MAVNSTLSAFTKETTFHAVKYIFDGSAKLFRRYVPQDSVETRKHSSRMHITCLEAVRASLQFHWPPPYVAPGEYRT